MVDKNELSEEYRPKIKTLLVVEDDAEIGRFLVQAVQDETSYEASLATDGFEALEMVRSLIPDLFVLDYQLPSMNGIELYDHLHATEDLKHIPTLLMSANCVPLRELKNRRIYFIKKPFDLDEMLQTIENLIVGPSSP